MLTGRHGSVRRGHPPLTKNPYALADIGRRKLSKYNEYRVLAAEPPEWLGKIESYFRCLDHKFVTPRINGIFHGINELKLP